MNKNKTIYLAPYAHLDTQWRWEYPTTIKEYIKNTIEENIALLEKYPEYCFNFTGAIRYEMMKEYYPEGFETVKKYIKEGRWYLAGTCLDETDTIVPSVESMIRNVLYGNEWQKREFGISSRDYMLPDCFGFPANMPTVLNHCGINGFSTQKLTWGSAVGIPFNIGKWIGPDNSQMLCALDPGEYVDCLTSTVQETKKRVVKLNSQGEKTGVYKTLQYYGVGDVGGAPEESSVINAIASEKLSESSDIKVVQTSCTNFFESFDKDEIEKLQEYKGDLLLTQHSAGSISSQAIMKRWNRQNEQLAFVAEYYALVAEMAVGLKYPHERINKAWKKVIGNQMHDILPGTCTPTAYEYSCNDEVIALKEWSKIIEDSIVALLPHIGGNGNIVVANPFEFQRMVVCEMISECLDINKSYCLKDSQGNSYNAQVKDLEDSKLLVVAEVALEAFEIKRFVVEERSAQSGELTLRQTNENVILENKYLRLSISLEGEIFSLFDKARNCEMFAKPLSYHLQKESPKEYPAWNMDWKDRKRAPSSVISKGSVRIVEDGNVRKTIEIETKLKKSILIKEISLTENTKYIDITERIKWREKGVSLKLAISANVNSPKFIYNWETSVVERPINNEKQYEVPSRYFADISNQNGGIAILENSKYGYDRPREDTLRLTLLYTPNVRLHKGFNDQKHQDFGMHTIKYALYPHGAGGDVDFMAKSFNRGVRVYQVLCEDSNACDLDLIEFDGKTFGVMAIKKAESQDGYIIRVYNRNKKDDVLKLKFLKNINAVYEVSGMEEPIREVDLNNNCIEMELKANGILSLLVKISKSDIKAIPQKCLEIKDASEFNLLPKILLGNVISSGNIDFNLGNNDLKAMICKGQKIDLDSNKNTVSLLICAEEMATAQIKFFDSNNIEVHKQAFTAYPTQGFVGQYDNRKWQYEVKHAKNFKRDYVWLNKYIGIKNGWIRPSKLCAYTTHTHCGNQDLYYQHGYIEQIDISVVESAVYMTMPDDNRIKVLAITQSQQKVKLEDIANKCDKFDF